MSLKRRLLQLYLKNVYLSTGTPSYVTFVGILYNYDSKSIY